MALDASDLVDLRRRLHRHAELSSCELETAAIVDRAIQRCRPGQTWRELGGHGAAYLFKGRDPGPTVLLRADLDALPIPETLKIEHASKTPGIAHKCGHDGHMAMLIGLAASLSAEPLRRGRAVLLFQPAEETGEGAACVLADHRFAEMEPDFALAIHNLPGSPLGHVVLRQGTFNCASVGLVAQLEGKTSHAAEPEVARSPTAALASLLESLPTLPGQLATSDPDALVTITHANLGEPTLGITPGRATLMATLRATSDSTLDALVALAQARLRQAAEAGGLSLQLVPKEPFRAVHNHPQVVGNVAQAAQGLNLPIHWIGRPFRFSEDFAEFTARYPGALLGLGAGVDHPPLHAPTYDFPDALVPIGQRLLRRALETIIAAH